MTLGPGVHESGCLMLRSNVELHLAKGAVLKAPPTMAGYPQRKLTLGDAAKVPRWNAACFIFAEGATNVAITGEGTIDANGRGANNVSLPVNRVCERMVVSNCVLRSYANGIRIGWINDGVIRNGLFRDIRIRKSTNGIGLVLPPPFTPSDVGREATRFDAFENIVFRNVHARGLKLPTARGDRSRAGVRARISAG